MARKKIIQIGVTDEVAEGLAAMAKLESRSVSFVAAAILSAAVLARSTSGPLGKMCQEAEERRDRADQAGGVRPGLDVAKD